METMMNKYETIDQYIANFPEDLQAMLQEVRMTIKKAAPQASEKINYGIPTFFLNGNLVHFGGYKTHIGFYPGSGVINNYKEELSAYELSKGTVRFSLDKPVPFGLISKIVAQMVNENIEKSEQ